MSEADRTQAQQNRSIWTKAVEDQAARVEDALGEVAKMQTAGIEQAFKNVDEASRLTKETFAYATELASHWRKMMIEATRRTADLVAPKSGA
jgi:hypothetical protein